MQTWREISMMNYLLDLSPVVKLTPTEFEKICHRNPDVNLELAPDGRLVIVAPCGLDSSGRSTELTVQIAIWARENGGKAFDSSPGFTLPNNAVRSPDASWLTRAKWEALSRDEQRKFSHVVPDFVAEVRSPSDSVRELREKMAEYVECGVRLAWLIDPETRTVEIYRPAQPPEQLENPATLSGEDVMPGLLVDLTDIL